MPEDASGRKKGALSADALRFLVAGAANTLLTILVYQILLAWMAPSLAYAGAWITGLLFVALVYPDRVFKGGRRGPADRARVALSYAAVFFFGLAVLNGVQRIGVPAEAAVLVVVVMTTVLNFFLSRLLLRRP